MDQNIDIKVTTAYLTQQSDPDKNQYVFSYTIRIRNLGKQAARLMSRHWIITNANGQAQEVKGNGVVGEQPYILPGDSYEYTSGAVLTTPLGSMHGTYQMITDTGESFTALIPPFSLAIPNILH